ncbi:MAG: ABC transporter ATP-binding protein [Candidatus Melainabacteria bacterium]
MAIALNFTKDFPLYRRMLGYLKPYKKRFTIAVLASLPVAALQGAAAWLIGPFTDELLKKQDFTMLLIVPVLMIGATIIQGVCNYLNEYFTSYIGQSVTQTMRSELFRKISTMELAYFKKYSTPDLLTRYCTDPAQLQMAINDNLQDLIVKIATILGLTAVLLYRNWQYALISLCLISLVIIPLAVISKKIRAMDHVTRDITYRIYVLFNEYCSGYKINKVFQLDGYQHKRYDTLLKEYFSAAMRINKAGIVLKPIMNLIATIGVSSVLAIGVFQIQNGQMTPGDLTSFLIALILLIQPIKTVGSVFSKMQRIFAPADRVFEKMDLQGAVQDPAVAREMASFESITFDHVSFEYEPGKPVLNDVSLTIPAGQTYALVGSSGGGKSTLVDLISRFMDPTTGSVKLNNIDLRDLTLDTIRGKIAIVSQDAILFGGSIRQNVALGRLNATDAEIREAMQMAYLTDWVDSLENGWDTPVGDGGCLLSGGQKQRVTIARAFLKNAPILILDEATSALDNESEAIVQQALTRLLKGRTVVVIAHRLSTITHADQIVVMAKGRIEEQGTHQELLAHQGIYNRLYQMQFRDNDHLLPELTAV